MVSTPRRRPPRGPSDAAVVGAVLGGSREHFDRLYDACFPRVYGYARRRLADPADAEAATREAMIAAFDALPTWRSRSSLAEWIFGETRNAVDRRCRARLPRRATMDDGAVERL